VSIDNIRSLLAHAVLDARRNDIHWTQLGQWLDDEMKSQGMKRRVAHTAPKGEDAKHFERFWTIYPTRRRVDKAACLRKWVTHRLDEHIDAILKGIAELRERDSWDREGGQYVPMAATFLNQRRWESVVVDDDPFDLKGAL